MKKFWDQLVEVYYDEVRKNFLFLTFRDKHLRLQESGGFRYITDRRKLPRKLIKIDSFIEDQRIGERYD